MGNNREKLTNDRLDELIKILEEHCIKENKGGPFASIILRDGEVVGVGFNTVLSDCDPTRHAEMNAISNACHNLNTLDLSDCELYATGYPCPMCMSAIIWANIKKVYYSADYKDAEEIGFRDDFIFNFLKNECIDKKTLDFEQIDKESIIKLYKKYKNRKKEIY